MHQGVCSHSDNPISDVSKGLLHTVHVFWFRYRKGIQAEQAGNARCKHPLFFCSEGSESRWCFVWRGSDYHKSHSGADLGSRLGTGLFFCMSVSHVRREAAKTGVCSLQNPPHGFLSPTFHPAGGRWWDCCCSTPPLSTPPHCSPLPRPLTESMGCTHSHTLILLI